MLVLFSNLYSDKYTDNLNRLYKKIKYKNQSSIRALNEIKMLYIDSILSDNINHQKISIIKLINGSKKLNVPVPAGYYKELDKLNSTKYSNNISSVSASGNNSKRIIKSAFLKNGKINIITSSKALNKDIKQSQWNTNGRYRHIYDIKGRWGSKKPKTIKISRTKKIQIAQYKPNTTRLVISDTKPINSFSNIWKNNIFITFNKTKNIKPKTRASKQKKTKKTLLSRDILNSVIVIDAGHGGKDGGAVGYKKIKEKHIALDLSKHIYNNLKAQGYKKVYLTRTRDTYIALQARTKFANKKKADIFISIHANAAKSKKAQGIETYFLSQARSKRAKKAAAKENKKSLKSLNFSSKNIFLNVLNKSRLVASNRLAIDIHKHMKFTIKQKTKSLKDHGVRSGPFWVLVGAQMPAVLVEVGYVTNRQEAKRLATKKYRKLIAKGIASGISGYLSKNK